MRHHEALMLVVFLALLLLVKVDAVSASADCQISDWYNDICDANHQQVRRRVIIVMGNGRAAPCPTNLEETISCSTPNASLPADADCRVGDWVFDVCTSNAIQVRRRVILEKNRGNGKPCPALEKTAPCSVPTPVVETTYDVDCHVGAWSYDACNTNGLQVRRRNITQPPERNGTACPALEETVSCALPTPAVTTGDADCQVSAWSYDTCDSASGLQLRHRSITQHPQGDGVSCPKVQQTVLCSAPSIVVPTDDSDCKVSDWSDDSYCDADGSVKRYRMILEKNRGNGTACTTDLTANGTCRWSDPYLVTDLDCMVTDWQYDVCEPSGQRMRRRMIIARNRGTGDECPKLEQSVPCAVPKLVAPPPNSDCEMSPWFGDFCEANSTQLQRRIILQKNRGIGEKCPAEMEQRVACSWPQTPPQDQDCYVSQWYYDVCDSNALAVRRRAIMTGQRGNGKPCPTLEETIACPMPIVVPPAENQDCEVTYWMYDDECVNRKGVKRRAIVTKNRGNGTACPVLEKTEDCLPYNGMPPNADCRVTKWYYDVCNVNNILVRRRAITSKNRGSGAPCPVLEQTLSCVDGSVIPDLVDCVVGNWSKPTKCFEDHGQRFRKRKVKQPALHGGVACPSLLQYQKCTTECQVGNWSAWSACDEYSGRKNRTREIVLAPQNQTRQCPPLVEIDYCEPVPCEVGAWGNWTCDASTGKKTRTRGVVALSRYNSGTCDVALNETTWCDPIDCQLTEDESYGAWSSCDPKTCEQTAEHAVLHAEQYGGKACEELPGFTKTQPCTDKSSCEAAVEPATGATKAKAAVFLI